MKTDVKFSESNQSFAAKFGGEEKRRFHAGFSQTTVVTEYVGGEPFDGPYDIRPQLQPQTLETKDKVLVKNLTVDKIPITSVSNQSGGNTIIIG